MLIEAPGIKQAVVEEVRKFLSETGMSNTAFGIRVKGDHKFVDRLFQPTTDVMASNLDRCVKVMEEYREMLAVDKDHA